MSLGTRGHDVCSKTTAKELSNKLSELKLKNVQLVPYKSIEGCTEINYHLDQDRLTEIKKQFQLKDINISIIGAYFNPICDIESKHGYNRFVEYLSYAKYLGCDYVATETGSLNNDYSYNSLNSSDEAFNKLLYTIRKLCKEASKLNLFVAVEVVWSHVISDQYKMKRLLDLVNSDRLRVIFDPVNMLNSQNWQSSNHIIEDVFNMYSDKIIAIHAKDFIVENDQLIPVALGKGILDYELLFKLIEIHTPNSPVIMEELTGDKLIESYQFLSSFYN